MKDVETNPKRTKLRLELRASLVASRVVNVRRVHVGPVDDELLADLMFDSYSGMIDEEENHSVESCLREVERTRGGNYGRFIGDASFVIENGGSLAAASLVTLWYDVPLLAFIMTRGAFKRRGYARAVFTASANALLDVGFTRVDLVVTNENLAAISLYRQLGFAAIEPPN